MECWLRLRRAEVLLYDPTIECQYMIRTNGKDNPVNNVCHTQPRSLASFFGLVLRPVPVVGLHVKYPRRNRWLDGGMHLLPAKQAFLPSKRSSGQSARAS